MVNNDAQPFCESETVVPDGDDVVSYGFLVARQATKMGLAVLVSLAGADPLDGNYTVVVETAVAEDVAAADWAQNVFDSVSFGATGSYLFTLAQPIFDKVRVRITSDATHPEYASIQLQWLCDTELTSLDPTL